ncbi:MAG: hypothetical protein LBE91_18820 [Tannerella sp.]|jgi:hypothetical protein|nr:hypothetical protein [Tannerella sp.]
MKRTVLLLMAFTSLAFTGCQTDTQVDPEPATSRLIIRAANTEITTRSGAGDSNSQEPVVFTGDDILWFNETTGELRFKGNTSMRSALHGDVKFYLGDEFLFPSMVFTSDLSSMSVNSLVLYHNILENKLYLANGYPAIRPESGKFNEQQAAWQIERAANRKKITSQWAKFIEELKKEGKYQNSGGVPVESNPAAGKLSVVATRGAKTYAGGGEDIFLAFTSDDIKSFDPKWGQLRFNNMNFRNLWDKINDSNLTFYLDDEALFTSASFGYDTLMILSNYVFNDLVFLMRGVEDGTLYLLDGFPELDRVEQLGLDREEARQIREQNAEKRKSEWAVFLRYLTDNGKIVPDNDDGTGGGGSGGGGDVNPTDSIM